MFEQATSRRTGRHFPDREQITSLPEVSIYAYHIARQMLLLHGTGYGERAVGAPCRCR